MIALVEGQEYGGWAVQPRYHVDLTIAHREMHERPVRKGQQRLDGLAFGPRKAVKAILVDCVANALSKIRFQFDRRYRHAIEEKHEVEAVFVVEGIPHLPDHAQPVGPVAGENVRIDRQRRFELRQLQRLLQAQHFDAIPQHIQCAALVELVPQTGEQCFAGPVTEVLGEGFPSFGLCGPHPGQDIRWEERPRPVVADSVAVGIKPAVGGEVFANLGLERDFFVQANEASFFSRGRTSI